MCVCVCLFVCLSLSLPFCLHIKLSGVTVHLFSGCILMFSKSFCDHFCLAQMKTAIALFKIGQKPCFLRESYGAGLFGFTFSFYTGLDGVRILKNPVVHLFVFLFVFVF